MPKMDDEDVATPAAEEATEEAGTETETSEA